MGCSPSKNARKELNLYLDYKANDEKIVDTKIDENILKIFNKIDINKRNISLSEVDFVINDILPGLNIDRKTVALAYKAADVDQSGQIELNEFKRLMQLLQIYSKFNKLFEKLDKNHDKKISFEEFKEGHKIIGMKSTNNEKLKQEYKIIDEDNSGYIQFDELCLYLAKKYYVEAQISL
ncbi:hypothetical protein HK099_001554 [Clydaea vesicula]|uniref:Calcineurin subunit B n=1 Tax=Clydaea vesicula TaxID=447962 RepID=A0AAD5U7S8_9FUNG|nr:hypothetical protein HK099_001554 [Clydaea vesicula]